MGKEADITVHVNAQAYAVKALLETHELILRHGVRKTIPFAEITDLADIDGRLEFRHGGDAYALHLPAGQAAKWLDKIMTPPPSLAHKLGIDAGHKALVHGDLHGHGLRDALAHAVTTDPQKAAVAVAIAHSLDELRLALADLTLRLPQAPIWIVYPKGARSPLPEGEVRGHMRGLGFVDTKTCAVSEKLTALRFSRKK